MLRTLAETTRKACRAKKGSVAIMVALSLSALIGCAALGSEVVFVLFKQRQMQATASSAAFAGATALVAGHPSFNTEAQAVAASNGFKNGTASVVVLAYSPPHSGPNTSNAGAVEVIISQPQTLSLISMFRAGAWTISARAVATKGNGTSVCVAALDPGVATVSAPGIQAGNGATVALNQCGLASNSTGNDSLQVTGGASITATSVSVSGFVDTNNGGVVTTPNGVLTQQAVVGDPYSSVPVPTGTGCKYGSAGNPLQVLGWQNPTLSADGVYCGGLSMGGGGSVKMNPGIYIINGGTFSVGGGTSLSGTGVTIVLTGSGTNYATVSIGNGVSVTLSAPTTGATAGLVFFQNRAAPASGTDTVAGGASMTLTGALYFPSQTVYYSNGSSTSATCTQLVAWNIVFQGGTSFNSNCAGLGVGTIGASPSQLVE